MAVNPVRGRDTKQSNNRHFKTLAGLILGAAAIITLSYSIAQAALPASCDPAYWDAMKGKAWIEAQREIEQNQNLIYKPDSVLEYTCFDQYLNVLAQEAQNLFSENQTLWGPVTPTPDMTNALEILVGTAATAYVNGNYGHDFLGDRASSPSYTLGNVSPGSYNCTIMSQVWDAAKCMNFVDKTAHDDFFDLTKYDGWDARQLVNACSPDTRWNGNAQLAANNPVVYAVETYNTYTNHFDNTSCAAQPIPTGITVTRPPLAAYQEHICVNPGCAYDMSGACTTSP